MFRKTISILLISFLMMGLAVARTPGYRAGIGTGEIMGQGKYPYEAGKTFRLVRFVQTTTQSDLDWLTKDSIVVWSTAAAAADGVTVTETTETQDSRVAGILAADVQYQPAARSGNTASQDYGASNWTYVQTYGAAEIVAVDAVPTSGDALGTSATAGRGGVVLIEGGGTDPENMGIAGFWMSDPNGAGEANCDVFIKTE